MLQVRNEQDSLAIEFSAEGSPGFCMTLKVRLRNRSHSRLEFNPWYFEIEFKDSRITAAEVFNTTGATVQQLKEGMMTLRPDKSFEIELLFEPDGAFRYESDGQSVTLNSQNVLRKEGQDAIQIPVIHIIDPHRSKTKTDESL